MELLSVKNLALTFDTRRGPLRAIDGISFSLGERETLGIVGESGCGKSITSLALMGLLPPTATITADELSFMGVNLLTLSDRGYRAIRGAKISMIFQDPMTSLNPSFTVEYQICEALKLHGGGSTRQIKQKALDLLDSVGIPSPKQRMSCYPHQLSGGMCQRVMIAQAIACEPRLLIADEPTTALDVTIQAQILNLLLELQEKNNMALMLITHDIGVVAQTTKQIQVMYAGKILEKGDTQKVIARPQHPYTEGLLKSLPAAHKDLPHRSKLPCIPGLVPDLFNRTSGCIFAPRCDYKKEQCEAQTPQLEGEQETQVSCFYPLEGKS